MITKRRFLTVSIWGLAAGCAFPAAVLAGPRLRMSDGFTAANFRALLNTPFSVARGLLDLTEVLLVGVSDGPSWPGTEQFRIALKGAASQPLPEGLYEVAHPQMGRFQLHIEPTGAHAGAAFYSAAFSLVRG